MEEQKKPEQPGKPEQPAFYFDAIAKIKIAEDNMSAKIHVHSAPLKSHEITSAEIIALAQEHKIPDERIDFATIQQYVKRVNQAIKEKKQLPEEIVFPVANGVPAQPGIDGWKKFYFPISKKVNITDSGKADFRNIDKFVHVKKNEKVLSLFEGKAGEKGFDVFGKPVSPPSIIREKMTVGNNIAVKSVPWAGHEGLEVKEFYTAIDGAIDLGETMVSVSPDLVIGTNVGLATGNINYDGDVQVKGVIEEGAVLRCTGNLTVGGTIESGELIVGKNLYAKGGIRTKAKGKLKVAGDAEAKFLENSWLEVDGSLFLHGAIINSKVYCLHDIKLDSDSGSISGSEIHCFGNIEAKNLGAVSEAPLHIELGHHFKNDRSFKLVSENLKTVEHELEDLFPKIEKIKQVIKRGGAIDAAKKKEFMEVFQQYKEKEAIRHKLLEKQEELKEHRYNSDPVRIVCKGTTYPNVTINWKSYTSKSLTNELNYVLKFIPGQPEPFRTPFSG